jgi:dipeptidyl aminopeptidase/acylaminoacyl peptidase
VLSAGDIAISDTANNFSTDTVQGAIDQLFTSANSGKTAIASAIGSPAEATNTFAQLAEHVTTGKDQIANAINDGVVNSNSTFVQLRDAVLNQPVNVGVNKNVRLDEDVLKNDVIESYYRSMSLTKVDPTTAFPNLTGRCAAFSSDGQYLSVGFTASPFLAVYRITGSVGSETITQITLSGTLPTNVINKIQFSPNGEFLACACDSTTRLIIFRKMTPTEFSSTGITITTQDSGNVDGIAWSPDSQFLTTVSTSTPFFRLYRRNGSAFTRLTDTTFAPSVAQHSTTFSPDGSQLLFASGSQTTKITVLEFNGTTYTPVTATLNGITTGVYKIDSIKYSPDGNFIAFSMNTSPFIQILSRSGTTFTRILSAQITTLPVNDCFDVSWTSDGQYLIAAHARGTGNDNSYSIYRVNGTGTSATFTRISNPATINPTTTGWGCAVSPNNNRYILISHIGNPAAVFYRNDGEQLFVKANPNGLINSLDTTFGFAKVNGTSGNQISAGIVIGGGALP